MLRSPVHLGLTLCVCTSVELHNPRSETSVSTTHSLVLHTAGPLAILRCWGSFPPWAPTWKAVFHADDYRQFNRQRKGGLKDRQLLLISTFCFEQKGKNTQVSFHHFSIINDKKNGYKNALKQRRSGKRKLCIAHSGISCSQREKQQGGNRMPVDHEIGACSKNFKWKWKACFKYLML